MKRDFLTLADWRRDELEKLLSKAAELKATPSRYQDNLRGKTLAMIFAKPSQRTRVSFEVGMFQLGGQAIFLTNQEIQPGKREAVSDLARTLSGYVDAIMIRTFAQEVVEEFARYASVPVINGLTDKSHPCQALADVFTIYEKLGRQNDITLVYVGDGNNVLYSLIFAGAILGINLRIASPPGYQIAAEVIAAAQKLNPQAQIINCATPADAVKEADVIYTDVWVSMGQEEEKAQRLQDFAGYQVNEELLAHAKPDCLVMHCLPAHRGEEISAAVLESPNSIVFTQAHNRLHVQKAILLELIR